MKVIAIIGYHNSGKTTLVEGLIYRLERKGYKVGYIKHDPKAHGETDRVGSDTYRVFGIADRVALASPDRLTLWDRREDEPTDIIKEFFRDFDIVILEGFKSAKDIPKVALGDVEAHGIVLRLESPKEIDDVIELLESMEENL